MEFLRRLFKGKKTILVADDEPGLLETTVLALQHKGYRVLKAANGSDAFAIALSVKPDLIVLDIRMPGMDGWDVLGAVRSSKVLKATPVLMLTTVNQTGDINKSFEMGASDYIIKPLDAGKLYRKVEALIGLP
ncbi:MAG: response regulator [Elusimicrobia bacterium]|nr:response regulator [Elusimicrobiota bacterium]